MALVTLESESSYGLIRINRPDKRNAMNLQARDELRACLATARGTCKVIIITGVDDIFCGGIDLKEVQAEAETGSKRALTDWRDLNAAIPGGTSAGATICGA